MSRRLMPGLATVMAVVAFAVVPAVAQAEPHWYKKGVVVGSAHLTTTTIGTLTLKALGAEIKCKVNDKEEIWNPIGGGAGEDLMTGFALIGCKNKIATPACPKGAISVIAEGLPWRTLLVTTPPPGSVIRDLIFGVKLNVGCANSAGTVGDVFEGTLSPEVVPGAVVFGPGSGTLLDSGGNPLTITGVDKITLPPGKIEAKDP
jgi:hypothetical protein